MLTTFNPSKKSHSHILEGCLCVFLDHLGSSLSLAVFTGPQPPQEQETFAGLLPPQGLQDMSALASENPTRAIQLEAPYLIHILDNVMTFINTHQTLISFRSASSPSSFRDSSSSCSNAFAK
jgi:hypothetical protein